MTPDDLAAIRARADAAHQAYEYGISGTTTDALGIVHESQADVPALLAEIDRLTRLLGSHSDGHRCTCTMLRPASYHGYFGPEPAEWEQDPWCPTHPAVDHIRADYDALDATVQRVRDLLSAQTVGWVERDGYTAWVAADAIRAALDGEQP